MIWKFKLNINKVSGPSTWFIDRNDQRVYKSYCATYLVYMSMTSWGNFYKQHKISTNPTNPIREWPKIQNFNKSKQSP